MSLEAYRGPIDLLLYLVRRQEVPLAEISLAEIADQFLETLEGTATADFNSVGEFLEVASILAEMKARLAIPGDESPGDSDDFDDPHQDLVRQLLVYKEFRDAASSLEEQSSQWQRHFTRVADDAPPRRVDPANQPVHEVELWDLVSALGRVIRQHRPPADENVVYDETPIQVYMQQIRQQLEEAGRVALYQLFEIGMHKSAIVGIFLALLELARHHSVRAEQIEPYGEIWIYPGENLGRADTLASEFDRPLTGEG